MTQAPPLFPPDTPPPTPEQAQRTRELQSHYAAQNAEVRKTRTDERARIAAHDAKGRTK
jgi:hypothetical protein